MECSTLKTGLGPQTLPCSAAMLAHGSDGKESTCNAGDRGSVPGLGRSPGEGNGYLLQYSCLENSVDRGAWRPTVPWGCKELDMTERLTLLLLYFSGSKKKQGNYMGLKITACKPSRGKFWMQKIQSDQKTQLALLKSLEQKHGVESKSRVLCMPPTHNTT